MGSGRWDTNVYTASSTYRRSSGISDFEYSDSGATTVHARLSPLNNVRESRDSAEHPQSKAIAVLLDVTGSMNRVPRDLQTKLPGLYQLLLDKGYVKDPQILFGAIGDATCDKVPLQIGQFESDNRSDEDLRALVLEGGGGGQMTESYELAMYFMARSTSIDCFDKRGQRGYLFIIGDEMPYDKVSRAQVQRWVGGDLTETLTTDQLVEELCRKYHVYYILPAGSTHMRDTTVQSKWRALLGQNVILLDDLNATCETIALTIGLSEGAIDLDTGLTHLADVGSGATVKTVEKALATVVKGAVATGPELTSGGAASHTTRL